MFSYSYGLIITLVILRNFYWNHPNNQNSYSNFKRRASEIHDQGVIIQKSNTSRLINTISVYQHTVIKLRVKNVLDKKMKSRQLLLLLLLTCGDVHPNPGPNGSIYPCGFCEIDCDWSCQAICCDECSVWYHKSCLGLSSREYEQMGASNVSWQCLHCNSINVNSFTYHSYNIPLQNSFSILQDADSSAYPDTGNMSPISNFKPKNASSPIITQCRNPSIYYFVWV